MRSLTISLDIADTSDTDDGMHTTLTNLARLVTPTTPATHSSVHTAADNLGRALTRLTAAKQPTVHVADTTEGGLQSLRLQVHGLDPQITATVENLAAHLAEAAVTGTITWGELHLDHLDVHRLVLDSGLVRREVGDHVAFRTAA